MSGQGAIVRAEGNEPLAQHHEMARLVIANSNPVIIEVTGLAGESGGDVPGEINRIELDMGERMQQGNPSLCGGERSPPWHRSWLQQDWLFRAGRAVGGHVVLQGNVSLAP